MRRVNENVFFIGPLLTAGIWYFKHGDIYKHFFLDIINVIIFSLSYLVLTYLIISSDNRKSNYYRNIYVHYLVHNIILWSFIFDVLEI